MAEISRVAVFGKLNPLTYKAVEGATVSGTSGNLQQEQVHLSLRKLPSMVLPSNASAVETPGLAGLPKWLAEQIADLNQNVNEGTRAAALVR